MIDQDCIQEFGKHVVDQIDKLTNWNPGNYARLSIEGGVSAGRTRELISAKVSNDLGDTLRKDDVVEMVRCLRMKDTLWCDKQSSQFPGLTAKARLSQYKVYVRASYRALVKEKQRTFIATLPLIDRVGVVVGLLLSWYRNGMVAREK
jgi:hypothetical protein